MLFLNGIIVYLPQGCPLVKNKDDENLLYLTHHELKIFEEDFLIAQFYELSKNKTLYHNLKTNKINDIRESEEDQEIVVNNFGFRSDNFIKNTETDILFAGCSETMGIGGSLKETWAYMLNLDLNLNRYINIGMAGAGYQQIINNCIIYIKKYGPPKNLFILFPNIEREIIYGYAPKYSFDEKKKRMEVIDRFYDCPPNYFNWALIPTIDYYQPKDQQLQFPKDLITNNFSYKTKLFAFHQCIYMLENIAKQYNINFYWTSHSRIDRENFKKIYKFNNFIYYAQEDLVEYLADLNLPENKNNLIFKPDGHAGVATHQFWKKIFIHKVIL